jgi:ethanolamine permease
MSEQRTVVSRELKPQIGTWQLWAIAVGLVISGEYFGWSFGWGVSGTIGFLISVLIVTVMYVTFIFSYTELTTSIPHAGGPFAYGKRAFGDVGGFLAGFATLVEFVFAPPAIALSIGAYVNFLFPAVSPILVAVVAYFLFVGINLLGVKIAASFELVVTVLAVAELLVFIGVVAPGFRWENFTKDAFLGGVPGMFAAIPFAIWFFLAIEGVAMSAEEVKNPIKAIPRAYISGILTLVALALGVMVFAGGVGDWKVLAGLNSPLPDAMRMYFGGQNIWTFMLGGIGCFGLVASFHGIILGYSRQIFALARAGFLPPSLGKVHKTFKTPHWALVAGGVVGILSVLAELVFPGVTAQLITMSAMGAVLMYLVAMASLFQLRKTDPDLERPFKAPMYPLFPAVAVVLSLVALAAMIWFNLVLTAILAVILVAGWVYFSLTHQQRAAAPFDPMLEFGGVAPEAE